MVHYFSFRAFIAWEEHAIVDTNLEHKLRANLADYRSKLLLQNDVLPDPFTLKDGWFGEDERSMWPHLYISYIVEYLKETTTSNLYRKLLNEYKLGKAYR